VRSAATFIRSLTHPVITSRGELVRYVTATVVVCVAIALCFDVVNQLVFFDGWTATLRSWTVTFFVALVISAPISWMIGRAHLELFNAKRDAEILSRTDPLTGLPNRRAIFEIAEGMHDRAMILVILDIDSFKRVNDTHGHLVGDEVIVAFARMLCEEVGALGSVGRIGGEEFMLVAPNGVAERLIEALPRLRGRVAETSLVTEGRRVTVTISAGVAGSMGDGDLNTLYREADRVLYIAKSLGRNRIVYSETFARLLGRPLDRDEAMWRADAAAESTSTVGVAHVA
jgi:diguanylate cyclase (GGDEF)-like protein